jgi:hypothetical protein
VTYRQRDTAQVQVPGYRDSSPTFSSLCFIFTCTVFLKFTLDISEHPWLSHAYVAVTYSPRSPANNGEARLRRQLLRVTRPPEPCDPHILHVYGRDGWAVAKDLFV